MLMPGMDGPTFVRVVRRIEPEIRIIGISGVGEATAAADIESLALSALIVKPFTGASLAFALHSVLQAPPGTKVTHSASPWRGVSAAPWGPSPGAAPLMPQQSGNQSTAGSQSTQASAASGSTQTKTP
jgi:DNA-binding response OmpR family regulator